MGRDAYGKNILLKQLIILYESFKHSVMPTPLLSVLKPVHIEEYFVSDKCMITLEEWLWIYRTGRAQITIQHRKGHIVQR